MVAVMSQPFSDLSLIKRELEWLRGEELKSFFLFFFFFWGGGGGGGAGCGGGGGGWEAHNNNHCTKPTNGNIRTFSTFSNQLASFAEGPP